MKKKIQKTEVTQKFKDPNDRVMKLITSDVLEVSLFLHSEVGETGLIYNFAGVISSLTAY